MGTRTHASLLLQVVECARGAANAEGAPHSDVWAGSSTDRCALGVVLIRKVGVEWPRAADFPVSENSRVASCAYRLIIICGCVMCFRTAQSARVVSPSPVAQVHLLAYHILVAHQAFIIFYFGSLWTRLLASDRVTRVVVEVGAWQWSDSG